MLDPIFANPSVQFVTATFLAISIILILRNILFQRTGSTREAVPDSRYQHSALNAMTLDHYANELKVFLLETESYLDADLSLDQLSEKTNIPKHHFSQLFNIHLQKNFYQILAEYRIAYALELLKEGSDLKIEYLAYECGYHSRTTFNKHFKEQVGLTPSDYRSSLS